MSFEDEVARVNQHYFFREFTYSKTTFCPQPGRKVELADCLIWLDDILIVFQLKERGNPSKSDAAKEARWFERKVVTEGTRQIRDTLHYINSVPSIQVENHCGHRLALERQKLAKLQKVVCYLPQDALPMSCRARKFYLSKTAGIIHLFQAKDYARAVFTLLTPAELFDYLTFREELVCRWGEAVSSVPEEALLGHFLYGNANLPPAIDFVSCLVDLEHRLDEWDISEIIKDFHDSITGASGATDYYHIISELAKLKRSELREFKRRFTLSLEACRSNAFQRPSRMQCPRTDCAFVFVPLERQFIEHRKQALINFTFACKYDLKAPVCMGISFGYEVEEGGSFSISYCVLDSPWEYDPQMEELLRRDNPFREVRPKILGRYTFRGD
jgi:hypothetical protein